MTHKKLVIISGPSQVGKDAVVFELFKKASDLNLERVITYTSREKRLEEKEGIDHFFITEAQFHDMIEAGQFLEWMPVRNKMFGTPKKAVDNIMQRGRIPLLKIDVRGAKKVLEQMGNVLTIFILPDNLEQLKARMIKKGFAKDQLKIRWQETENELAESVNYDFRVVNKEGKLAETVEVIKEIIKNNT